MDLKRNQIIYTQAGFAKVKSVRSLNQTLQSLIKEPTKKTLRSRTSFKIDSSQPISPQSESDNTEKDPLDFNFGEVFLLLEKLAIIDVTNFRVELDGLIGVDFLKGGSGFISPK